MKRITFLIILSYFLMSCGGGKETVPEISVSEDLIASSLVQQEGERPTISPETLSPKVPPQKIISSSKAAPKVSAPKKVQRVVKKEKPVLKPQAADIKKTSVVKTQVKKQIPQKDTTPIVVPEPQKKPVSAKPVEVVTIEKTETPVEQQKSVPAGSIIMQNISFDNIYFETGEWAMPSATFNSNYYVTLGKLVKALRTDPDIKIRISGYTDHEGSEQYNYELSQKRSVTFGKLLLDFFPPKMRTDIAQRIEINPVGSGEILVEGTNKIRRILNRRVSFELFYGDLKNNPYTAYMDYKPAKISRAAATPSTSVKTSHPSSRVASIQQKLYDKATLLFNQKRYNESIDIYEEIIQINRDHSLADNAQFWIGEALYYQKQYPEALQAYQQVFGLGNRNKAASAQMRLGYCYFRMNQLDQSVAEFRKVIQNYPKATEEIRRAEMLLTKIRSN
ncbi:MAG: tetratricopeptide repeat protein [Candidatus Marinimicrobia bacterium]|nr:tetratricopeptide repeat protein [Candidatus Neomarinimicrobiota bacterium]